MDETILKYRYLVSRLATRFDKRLHMGCKLDKSDLESYGLIHIVYVFNYWEPDKGRSMRSMMYMSIRQEMTKKLKSNTRKFEADGLESSRDSEDEGFTYAAKLEHDHKAVCPEASLSTAEDAQVLTTALHGLTERQQDITYRFFYLGHTLPEIGEHYHVSKQAIHHTIQKHVLPNLRADLDRVKFVR